MRVLHTPVLADKILEIIETYHSDPKRFVDGTFGRGGHTQKVLNHFAKAHVLALDQDREAIEFGHILSGEPPFRDRVTLCHESFFSPPSVALQKLEWDAVDVVLLDLGVSSPQLDQPERGFSVYNEGPLDMRMDQRGQVTAAHLVNLCEEEQLNEIFVSLGEIQRPQKVVRRILEARRKRPIEKTSELAELIVSVEGWRRRGFHPATQYFMALRLAVNRELDGLESGLRGWMKVLAPGGLMLVLTFHSLEDRIVKYTFKDAVDLGQPLFKKVVVPDRSETLANPRSRSAKLRVFQRLLTGLAGR